MNPPIPTWILVISSIFALLGLWVSCSLIFSPDSVLETVDINAKGVNYLIYMWAARQFSVGFIFGFATFKKSFPMLTIAYIFFLVMNILDAIIGIYIHDTGLTIGASVMCVISSTMIYFLNKKQN